MTEGGGLAALSPEERRARLTALLRARAQQPRESPVSYAQRRLWLLDRLEPGTALYNLPIGLRLSGRVDLEALQRALDEIVRRHEVLRTTFAVRDGEPVQRVAPSFTVPLPVIDLRDRPATSREAEAMARATDEIRRPFDLAQGPLLRVGVVRLDEDEHLLFGVMHHSVFDGSSSRVLLGEMLALYEAFATGQPSALDELPVQYGDFAIWQRERLRGNDVQDQLAYWRGRLAGVPLLELPLDRSRPAASPRPGASRSFQIAPRPTAALKELSRREGVTPFMALLAVFYALLHRYTGQTDLAVGVPVAGRERPELAGLIGCFVNTLVLRADVGGDPSFRRLLRAVRDVTLGAAAHQELPFELLVEQLQPARTPGRQPLFEAMFVFHSVPLVAPRHPTVGVRLVELHNGTSKFDLSLEFSETADGLRGALEYRSDLFDLATASGMIGHLQALLEDAVSHPDRRLSELSLLTDSERRQLRRWNETRVVDQSPRRLHQLVEAQVVRTPKSLAVVFEQQALTYRELDERASALARNLRSLGVGAESVVGIYMERSLELVVALLAVLKAGGAYLPLEVEYPAQRLGLLAGDAAVRVLLTQSALRQRVFDVSGSVEIVELPPGGAIPAAVAQTHAEPRTAGVEDPLAYVIYTSGSTGPPKGVMNTHRGICNRLLWMQATYELGPADRVLQKTPFSFDVSVWEFFWPLLAGATLVMARPGGHRDPAYLRRLIAEEAITVVHFVPSMLQAFLDEPGLGESCRSLRHVFCSGEVLPRAQCERFFDRVDAALHNLYGPTEAAVDVTAWRCLRGDTRRTVPIGRPIANTQIHVLDCARMTPTPIGLPGELCIGGVGLARGYLNRPELTAERFVPDPSGDPGGRLYRTGDLARWRWDGALEFLGRADDQVKLRGFRVEPGEIEEALARHPAVQEAVVVLREDRPGDPCLVAYVVPRPSTAPAPAELRVFLGRTLPEYLVPSVVMTLEGLPRGPNGKLDRKALPAPGPERPELSQPYAAPRTQTEAMLAGIWTDVLGLDKVGVHDNFFDLGGASIQCLRVVARAGDEGLALSPALLFEHQTIAELAAAVEAGCDR